MKGMEYKESVFFTIAFLFLIITATLQGLIKTDDSIFQQIQELSIIVFTIVFAISIPINIHKERIDKYRKKRNLIVMVIGLTVLVFVMIISLLTPSFPIILIVSTHLFLSVVYSMVFVLLTKPGKLILVREKSERWTAVVVLVIMTFSMILFIMIRDKVPLGLMQQNGYIIMAAICIILSLSKLPGDIKKLVQSENNVAIDESKLTLFGITQRESEVLQLLISGKTYKEIASQLFISLPTVKTHVSNIYSKVQVRNRLELSNLVKQPLDSK